MRDITKHEVNGERCEALMSIDVSLCLVFFFFFQAEDGIRDVAVTGVQTCALPISHLFEHMLFSGSEHVGNNEHFRYVQSIGGVLNGSTFFDRTNYYETLPSNYLALGLWLEADRMGWFVNAITQEKLDIQREVVKEERRQRYDNVPYGTAFERLLNLAYDPDYSYHWPTIGSMADLEAASLDDVREFFRVWYRPDNCTLTIVGDFSPEEAKRLINDYFLEIQPGGSFPDRKSVV